MRPPHEGKVIGVVDEASLKLVEVPPHGLLHRGPQRLHLSHGVQAGRQGRRRRESVALVDVIGKSGIVCSGVI
ncbi:hypothetical protein GUJ93_ZPchr0006g42762 [Zizania palustris]|uniref:Uncharacterized protein n=1 Tax=Zizania palustris TaxID=103762 RepID=A0A8J5SY75_ZIZPA|nr:hypothetical protein GUJ93_ZPchr0006g42762 [Zizania palustris]